MFRDDHDRTAPLSDYSPSVPSSAGAPGSRSQSPIVTRRSMSFSSRRRKQQPKLSVGSRAAQLLSDVTALRDHLLGTFNGLSLTKKIGVVVLGIAALVAGLLFLIFNERIFHALAPLAKRWRDVRGGWLVLWFSIFVISFPPLIGYGICVTLAGAVYGIWKGWLILASATVVGSTASFLASRYVFQSYVTRITANNKRFAALSLVLKHDGLKLLVMIRLCPLPYSPSNGFLATIPTVTPWAFAFATMCMTPKYFLHVFIGSRLAAIGENGDKMDMKTKAVSYASIAIGVTAGVLTGWFMYTKTTARARELDALEAETAVGTAAADGLLVSPDDPESGLYDEFEYSDDPDTVLDVDFDGADEDADAISLRTTDGYVARSKDDQAETDGSSRDLIKDHIDGPPDDAKHDAPKDTVTWLKGDDKGAV